MAAKYTSSDETEVKHGRFLDVGQEPRRMLQPIEGYQKMPLLTLDKAVEPIVFCCPDIHRRVFIAMSSCENPLDDLNQNESASIFLYTMEWEPRNECLYYVLNKTLRTENRQQLKPWYWYLRLIITALQKLPPQKLTVWRGVTLHLSREYEIGKRYVWWAFSSCSRSVAVLESEQFLGTTGPRTLFNIECHNGKTIRSHSYINVEDEILLLPATQFEVIGKLKPSSDLHIIHLKQVDPPFPLIELPTTTGPVQPTTKVKKNEEKSSHYYRNEKLEQLIAQCPLKSTVDLKNQELTDNDIPIIIQRAIIDKQCWSLDLASNMITDEGVQRLAKILESNTLLKFLSFARNQITDVGIHSIAQALRTNTGLTFFNLMGNKTTDDGAKFLAEAIESNATLQHLFIDYNTIGDNGVRYIAQSLTKNTTLKRLSLDNTGMTDIGVIYLAEVLKHNKTLGYLDLNYNPLTNKGVKTVLDALCNNYGLVQLKIKCKQMTSQCMKDIQNMLEQNDTLTELVVLRQAFIDQEQEKLQSIATTKQNRRINFVDK